MRTPYYDVETVHAALEARDGAALPTDALGFIATNEDCGALCDLAARAAGPEPSAHAVQWSRDALVIALAEAATNKSGVGIKIFVVPHGGWLALAWADDEHVHLGLGAASRPSTEPPDVWSELRPWYARLHKNRKRLAAWAKKADLRLRRAPRPPASPDLKRSALIRAVADGTIPDALEQLRAHLLAIGDAQGHLIDARANATPLKARFGARVARTIVEAGGEYRFGHDGVVRDLKVAAQAFNQHGREILDQHPVTHLHLHPVTQEAVTMLANTPHLDQLTALSLRVDSKRIQPVDIGELLRRRDLRLARLELANWRAAGPISGQFETTTLPLRELELSDVDEDETILRALASSAGPQIKLLTVRTSRYAPKVRVIARGALANLETLRVQGHTHLDPTGPRPTFGGEARVELEGSFPALRELVLYRCDAGALEDLDSLAPNLNTLRFFTAEHTAAVDRVAARLLALPASHPLRYVALPEGAPTTLWQRFERVENQRPGGPKGW